MEAVSIKCPNCSAGLAPSTKMCDYCASPVVITTFKTVFDMPFGQVSKYAQNYEKQVDSVPGANMSFSFAMCLLRLKRFDEALKYFEKAMIEDFTNGDSYFYACVALLAGRKPFVLMRPQIDKMLEYLHAAQETEPKAIYSYMHAYIKYDYFKRKFFNVKPSFEDVLAEVKRSGMPDGDKAYMFTILGQERPSVM